VISVGASSYVYLHGVQGCIWVVLVVDLGSNYLPDNVATVVSLFSIMICLRQKINECLRSLSYKSFLIS